MTALRTKPRRFAPLVALAILPAFLAACGDGGSKPNEASPERPAGAQVVMHLLAFKPETVEVTAGTTVTWVNRDTSDHFVVSGTVEQQGGGVTTKPDGTFASKELATGKRFRHTFDEPGTYSYFCSLHPATMRGEIRVSPSPPKENT